VGHSSVDLPLTATLQLRGPVVEVVERRHYLTQTSVAWRSSWSVAARRCPPWR